MLASAGAYLLYININVKYEIRDIPLSATALTLVPE